MKNNSLEKEKNRVSLNGNLSDSAHDFERDLYKLINAYANAGLNKKDLIHKMERVTQSCIFSSQYN